MSNAPMQPRNAGSATFPLIPLTAEFMKMLGTSDEKAIYALKPVFATRCERLSSTNKFLERAVLFSQNGSLLIIDTSNGRITHTLELGELRNTDWNVTIDADREKDAATQTQGVRITIDKGVSREAFDNMDDAKPPEEICLQFHCARAPVAVNFVAMARHFAAVKGPDGFQLRLSEHPLMQESRGRRGSLGDRLAAVRKSSLFSASPERSNSVAQVAKKKKREIEKRGEAIEVLPVAAVPSVRDQQRKEREDAAKRKRDKEAAERLLEEKAREAANPQVVPADELTGAAVKSPEDDYPSDDESTAIGGAAHPPANPLQAVRPSAGDDDTFVVIDDAYGQTTVDPPTVALPPPAVAASSTSQAQDLDADASSVGASGPMERGVVTPCGVRATTPEASSSPTATTPPPAVLDGGVSSEVRPLQQPAASDGGVRTLLERMRAESAAATKTRGGGRPTAPQDDGGLIEANGSGSAAAENDLNPDDVEEVDHTEADEDAFIDGLSPKEAQEVVAGIMRSIEALKEEQSRLMMEREAAQKSLLELTSVTLRAEHALGLAGIVWTVCDFKLLRHFNQR